MFDVQTPSLGGESFGRAAPTGAEVLKGTPGPSLTWMDHLQPPASSAPPQLSPEEGCWLAALGSLEGCVVQGQEGGRSEEGVLGGSNASFGGSPRHTASLFLYL